MTKGEFIKAVRALYRVANASDSDSAEREAWTVPAMAGAVACQHLDDMLHDMEKAGAITADERQELYDTL